jgi:hypothetical protein
MSGYLPVQIAPPGKDFHAAGIEPSMHAVAVEFDLVQPVGAVKGGF